MTIHKESSESIDLAVKLLVRGELFRKKRQIIIFPSYVPWRITKVTKGIRNAIEGWVHGPSCV